MMWHTVWNQHDCQHNESHRATNLCRRSPVGWHFVQSQLIVELLRKKWRERWHGYHFDSSCLPLHTHIMCTLGSFKFHTAMKNEQSAIRRASFCLPLRWEVWWAIYKAAPPRCIEQPRSQMSLLVCEVEQVLLFFLWWAEKPFKWTEETHASLSEV